MLYNINKNSRHQAMDNKQKRNITKKRSNNSQKWRRSSKISLALRNQFITLLNQDGITIKQVSKYLNINYSTAKVIAKQNKCLMKNKQSQSSSQQEQYLPIKIKKPVVEKKQLNMCSFRQINTLTDSLSQQNLKFPMMEVISTVAWNFLQKGLPIFSAQYSENQSRNGSLSPKF